MGKFNISSLVHVSLIIASALMTDSCQYTTATTDSNTDVNSNTNHKQNPEL